MYSDFVFFYFLYFCENCYLITKITGLFFLSVFFLLLSNDLLSYNAHTQLIFSVLSFLAYSQLFAHQQNHLIIPNVPKAFENYTTYKIWHTFLTSILSNSFGTRKFWYNFCLFRFNRLLYHWHTIILSHLFFVLFCWHQVIKVPTYYKSVFN